MIEDREPWSEISLPAWVGSPLTNYYRTLVRSQAEGKILPYFGTGLRGYRAPSTMDEDDEDLTEPTIQSLPHTFSEGQMAAIVDIFSTT